MGSLAGHRALPGTCCLVQLPQECQAAPVVRGFHSIGWQGCCSQISLTDVEPVRPIALRLSAMATWVQHTSNILCSCCSEVKCKDLLDEVCVMSFFLLISVEATSVSKGTYAVNLLIRAFHSMDADVIKLIDLAPWSMFEAR